MARPSRTSDDALLARLRAGDERAFELLHDRYRRPLVGYAGRFLRRSEHDAEDVVQDVLVSAHRALRADDRPVAVKAYLYKLTRNRCIDEVRRARWGEAELPEQRADHGSDPAMIFHRKETLHRLVEDVAALPERQRVALLARELDDQSAEDIGQELGMSTAATQMLIVRARDNLVKTRAARDADCLDIREELGLADERGVRLSEHAKRHVAGCDACAAYRRDLKRVGRGVRALAPPLGFLPLFLAGKLVGGGTGAAAVVQVAALAAGAAIAVGGGLELITSDVAQEGEASPFKILPGTAGAIPNPARLNRGSAVVTAKVELPAGLQKQAQTVTLTCPTGMVVIATAKPDPKADQSPRFSTTAAGGRSITVTFDQVVLGAPKRTQIGAVCRKPDANGSLQANPREVKPGETAGRVCTETYRTSKPGLRFLGTLPVGTRVAIIRKSPSGRFARIGSDYGPGWMAVSALC